MTDTKHTPEPWRATVNNINEIWLHSDHVSFIAHVNGPNRKGELNPDAIRIIACVNACAGMPDPAAEIAALRAERDEWKARCSEIGSALKMALADHMTEPYLHPLRDGTIEAIKCAIASAAIEEE